MKQLKVATIVGARPQFIKAAAVSRAIARHNQSNPPLPLYEVLIHTGQHYDYQMSAVFFRELGLAEPSHHLGVGSGPHGAQTGEMLKRVETALLQDQPDVVVVNGDTNSTLAGALAAVKLHIPVAHVEAGLRSFNRRMPEETNRVIADRISTWLFCPSKQAQQNLANEGIRQRVHLVGDVMYDVLNWHLARADQHKGILESLGMRPGGYALATVHREENTDDIQRLQSIFTGLESLARNGLSVVAPLHPRTQKALQAAGIAPERITTVEPVSYEEMLYLEANARVILTDSGGVQKEAYWLKVPCVTLREETEWVETVSEGWNVLVGSDLDLIQEAATNARRSDNHTNLYGDGHAAEKMVEIIASSFLNSIHPQRMSKSPA